MNKNKFHYVICVFFLSFAVFIDALQYTPALPARIKGRKQDSNLPKRAEKYINLFVPVGEESLAMRILSSEPIKQMVDFKQKKQELETSKETNNVYIYDESKNDGYLLTENMWSKSKTLKALMGDFESEGQKLYSIVHSYPYSADVIKTICYILKVCENASKENPCNDLVENIIENINFQTILPALICAHDDLDIDTYIIAELFKKVEQKIADLLNGHVVSAEDIKALDKMSLGSDLRKQLLGIKWEIFVEKFKLSVIKKCSFINPDNQPKAYTFGGPEESIQSVVFNPNNNYLFIDLCAVDQRWGTVRSQPIEVVDLANNMNTLKNTPEQNVFFLLWIDKTTFVGVHSKEGLMIFKCKGDAFVKSEVIKFERIEGYMDMMRYGDQLFFSAWSHNVGIHLGKWDYKKSNKIQYFNFVGIQGQDLNLHQGSKIITIDGTGAVYIAFSHHKDPSKMGIYKASQNHAHEGQFFIEEIASIDGILSSLVVHENKNKCAVIAENCRDLLLIYSLETRSSRLFKGENSITSLAFSPDGKIIVAVCQNELSIISAITGEKIGEFASAGGQVFTLNLSVSFNSDGTMLAIGRQYSEPFLILDVAYSMKELVTGSRSTEPNLLLWKWLPDKYVSIFKEMENTLFSFSSMALLGSLYTRTGINQYPIKLTDDEKKVFNDFEDKNLGLKIQQMLTDISYISSSESISTTSANVFQSIQPNVTWRQKMNNLSITAKQWWNYLMRSR